MDVAAYKEFLNQAWGKLYYEILFAQLAHIKNKKVLDFGSGFGLVADFLAQNNQVIAIEPNDEMIADVYQIQLITEQSDKNLAFYRSLGFRELSDLNCTGLIYRGKSY